MGQSEYLGTFEQSVLLALAAVGGEADGMSIYDELCGATGRDVSVPAVYVTLKRLEKKSMVSSEARPESDAPGAATRKVFTLEPEGVAALRRAKNMFDSLWERVQVADLFDGR